MVILTAIVILILYLGTIWVSMKITKFIEKKKLVNPEHPVFLLTCFILYVLEIATIIQIFFL